jgi:hypothetical protein
VLDPHDNASCSEPTNLWCGFRRGCPHPLLFYLTASMLLVARAVVQLRQQLHCSYAADATAAASHAGRLERQGPPPGKRATACRLQRNQHKNKSRGGRGRTFVITRKEAPQNWLSPAWCRRKSAILNRRGCMQNPSEHGTAGLTCASSSHASTEFMQQCTFGDWSTD